MLKREIETLLRVECFLVLDGVKGEERSVRYPEEAPDILILMVLKI